MRFVMGFIFYIIGIFLCTADNHGDWIALCSVAMGCALVIKT